MVVHVIREIFVGVVVLTFGCFDTNQRECIVTDDRCRQLLAGNELLRDDQRVKLVRQRECHGKLARNVYLGDTDRRAFARRFDNQWQAEIIKNTCEIAVCAEHVITRRRDARRLPHQLGTPLVHRERARHHARSGVRNVQRFQNTLHGAILAEASVQRDKHAIKFFSRQIENRMHRRIEGIRVNALLF